MQERISELADEAGFMETWFSESGDDCETELRKFAALIIKDCKSALYAKHHEGEFMYLEGCYKAISEHFGVKE